MDCIFHGLGIDRDMSGSRVSVGFLFCCPAFVGILEKGIWNGGLWFQRGVFWSLGWRMRLCHRKRFCLESWLLPERLCCFWSRCQKCWNGFHHGWDSQEASCFLDWQEMWTEEFGALNYFILEGCRKSCIGDSLWRFLVSRILDFFPEIIFLCFHGFFFIWPDISCMECL